MLNRNQLIQIVQRCLDRMLAHDANGLDASPDTKVTENGAIIPLGTGLFQTAQAIGFRQYFADTESQQVGFFGSLETSAGPRLLAMRLALSAGTITQIESIIAREGGHPLFAPKALIAPLPIYDEVVPVEERLSRDALIGIANLYFDAIEQANGGIAPCHHACNRRENGVLTTNNPGNKFQLGCRESIDQLTYIRRVRARRFPVVDEERGLVWSLVMFDMPSQQRSLRLAELFKIAAGQIREIEAVLINTPLGATTGWDL